MPILRQQRRGFMLLEVLVASMIIAIALVALLQIQMQSMNQFLESSHKSTGVWLANMKMAELMAENLPDPSEPDTYESSDFGDFEYLDERYNTLNSDLNEDWTDRSIYAQFKYEWTKELIFIGTDFIGNQESIETWEPTQETLDAGDAAVEDEDPANNPAARVVRITLKVFHEDNKGKVDPITELVTYVDPKMLYEAAEEEEDPTGTGDEGGGDGR
ncbi:MAG: type IV pilus modification PilV family protein [Planctomycetota bacterium]|jgi:type II secretory pathway pseudopilin PulG